MIVARAVNLTRPDDEPARVMDVIFPDDQVFTWEQYHRSRIACAARAPGYCDCAPGGRVFACLNDEDGDAPHELAQCVTCRGFKRIPGAIVIG